VRVRAPRARVEAGEVRSNQNRYSMCTRTAREFKTGVDMRAYWFECEEVPMGGYEQRERAQKQGRAWERKTVQQPAQGSQGPEKRAGSLRKQG
jgi:hypothetical protein